MLQKIQRNDLEQLEAFIKADSSIARCDETGAVLKKSRGQYLLIISENPFKKSHWSRRKVHSDDEAIQRAQRVLDRVKKTD